MGSEVLQDQASLNSNFQHLGPLHSGQGRGHYKALVVKKPVVGRISYTSFVMIQYSSRLTDIELKEIGSFLLPTNKIEMFYTALKRKKFIF